MGKEMSALAANRYTQIPGPLQNFQMKDYKKTRLEKDAKKCEHCGIRGHVRE